MMGTGNFSEDLRPVTSVGVEDAAAEDGVNQVAAISSPAEPPSMQSATALTTPSGRSGIADSAM
jgi:hypothetical protein